MARAANTTSLTPLSTYCSQSIAREGPSCAEPVRTADTTANTMSATSRTIVTRDARYTNRCHGALSDACRSIRRTASPTSVATSARCRSGKCSTMRACSWSRVSRTFSGSRRSYPSCSEDPPRVGMAVSVVTVRATPAAPINSLGAPAPLRHVRRCPARLRPPRARTRGHLHLRAHHPGGRPTSATSASPSRSTCCAAGWRRGHGLDVTLIRNVTDIDDKILREVRRGRRALVRRVVPQRTATAAALDALGVLPPTYEPRATGHVPEMVALMETLVDKGHAYAAPDGSGDVYFDVRAGRPTAS